MVLEAMYPEPDVVELILQKAFRIALSLASQLPQEVLDEKTKELLSAMSAQQAIVTTERKESEERKEEEEKKEEEKKEETSEEEALAGLSALFG
ncbi:MAG: hypothetical protein DRN30_03455 [Thermoplasmata archaeon]|nr:MAG: hypothetical protein DRN30_03455 [Thermoplasmata archaeon]